MRLKKTINVWVDEEPVDPKPGDLHVIEHMYREGPVYEVKRFVDYHGSHWVDERGSMDKAHVLEIYGIDIPSSGRAYLMGG